MQHRLIVAVALFTFVLPTLAVSAFAETWVPESSTASHSHAHTSGTATATPIENASKPGTTFLETFDGSPTGPTPFQSPNWDVAVHSRASNTWLNLEPTEMMHGADCSAPMDMHHSNGAYADAVFQCKDHLMTSLKATDYGVIYLTPNHLLDFSEGEAVIRWDMSTLRTSFRDWPDVWITPYEDNLQLPFNHGEVDLQGVPRNAVYVEFGSANGNGTKMAATVYKNFQQTNDFPAFSDAQNWYTGYESFLKPDAKRRDTFEIRISRTHLKIGMPAYNFWWVDRDIDPLTWSQGVVQFGHHSYNPEKHDSCGLPSCTANTFHWDNISLEPSVPFTLIKANRRYVTQATDEIRFAQESPEAAHVRFSGIGTIEVSFDDGKTWVKAQKQASSRQLEGFKPEHQANYWMAVPAGTQHMRLRFSKDSWYEGPYIAKDFTLWARPSGPGVPAPTPPIKPSATTRPTLVPTATTRPTLVPTATAKPTVIPSATATPNTVTFFPDADVSVDAGVASKNAGAAFSFFCNASPNRQSFVRFNVGGFTGKIVSAKLYLYVTEGTTDGGGTVRMMTNASWNESNVTYNQRPKIDGNQVGMFSVLPNAGWVEFDVTAEVRSTRAYSFGISQTGSDQTVFASREAEAAKRPKLVITTR